MISEIFCISILVGSMGLLIDLANQSQISSKKELEQFKVYTKKQLENFNNEKGQISFLGITILLMLSLLFYFLLQKMQIEKNEIQFRKNTYQCFFDYQKDLKSYIQQITISNKAIIGLNLIKYSGTLPVQAEASLKAIEVIQNAVHIKTLNSIMKNKSCSPLTKIALIRKLPYRRTLADFERNKLGITLVREEEWKLNFIGEIYHIRKKNLFLINANYRLKNSLSSSISILAKEKELPSLNSLLSSL